MNLLRIGVTGCVVPTRKLSGLKQFYLAVHPDLFGEHPAERLVNEKSLKSLNAFVDSLERKEFVNEYTSLRFFVKKDLASASLIPSEKSQLKQVSVELTSRIGSMKELSGILLAALNIPHGKKSTQESTKFPSDKDPYQSRFTVEYGGFTEDDSSSNFHHWRMQTEDFKTASNNVIFSDWLTKNWREAAERELAFTSSTQHINELRSELKTTLGATEIHWSIGWEADHYILALSSLKRIVDTLSQTARQKIVETIRDRVVSFTNQTGVTRCGHIALNPENVPATWRAFLVNAGASIRSFNRLPRFELAFSKLISGARIVRSYDSNMLATSYESRLKSAVAAFAEHLRVSGSSSADRSLQSGDVFSDVAVTLGSASESLQLLNDGTCLVPSAYSPQLVLRFLSENRVEAVRRGAVFARDRSQFERVANAVCDTFSLNAISMDENVSPADAIECVQRFVDLPDDCSKMLQGRSIRICTRESAPTIRRNGEIWLPSSLL